LLRSPRPLLRPPRPLVGVPRPKYKTKNAYTCIPSPFAGISGQKLGIMHVTGNLGRARHSVRAAVCQSTCSAGRGLPALPVVPLPPEKFVKDTTPSLETFRRFSSLGWRAIRAKVRPIRSRQSSSTPFSNTPARRG
jgi:hypothetical protein